MSRLVVRLEDQFRNSVLLEEDIKKSLSRLGYGD